MNERCLAWEEGVAKLQVEVSNTNLLRMGRDLRGRKFHGPEPPASRFYVYPSVWWDWWDPGTEQSMQLKGNKGILYSLTNNGPFLFLLQSSWFV